MFKSIITNPTVISIVNGQLRHLGTLAGGFLASRGLIEGSDVQTVVGVVAAIGAMALSALAKRA
jgi:hypothetical protein